MIEQRTPDVIVAGAGPVGMIAALTFAHAGFAVALAGPAPKGDDARTTALMLPALQALESIDLQLPADQTAPLAVMRIVDGTKRLLRSQPVTFRASEVGEPEFGRNVPNSVLNRLLESVVRKDRRIDWREAFVADWSITESQATARMADGASVSAPLVIAADGRNSAARAAAGITATRRDLPQSALVLNFGHSRPHGFTSTEFHTEEGPFTQVPLPGQRSSLVWVMSTGRASELSAVDESELAGIIEERMQSMLGRVTLEGMPQVWGLSSARPATLARNRVALVGEAAHVFPPIGAQGMNLGVRDVVDLAGVAADHRDDPGSEAALAAYRRARRGDVFARSSAVDLLNRTLLSDLLPAQFVRSAGLGLMATASPLRAFVMREGLSPGSGLAGLFSGLREKVRRQGA